MILLMNPVCAKTAITSLSSFEAPGDAIQMAVPESIEPDDPDSPQSAVPISNLDSNNPVDNNNTTTDNNDTTTENDRDINSSDVGAPPAQGS